MKKHEGMMVQNSGCEGCKKNCQWNARTTFKDARQSSDTYVCNSGNQN